MVVYKINANLVIAGTYVNMNKSNTKCKYGKMVKYNMNLLFCI